MLNKCERSAGTFEKKDGQRVYCCEHHKNKEAAAINKKPVVNQILEKFGLKNNGK